MEDDLLWARIITERRLLITTDKGFTQHRHAFTFTAIRDRPLHLTDPFT